MGSGEERRFGAHGLVPSVAATPLGCSSGKSFHGPSLMLGATSPGSAAASPRREAMPGLGAVEVSWVGGAGRADALRCRSRAIPGWGSLPAWPLPPTWHWDLVHRQPGVGMGTVHGDEGTPPYMIRGDEGMCGPRAGTKQLRRAGAAGPWSSPLARGCSLADGVDVVAGEEADAPIDLPLPPVGIGAVQDLDDVPAQEGQLGAVVG